MTEPLLTPAQVGEIIGVDPWLLAEWRQMKTGPPYLKLSHKVVRYDPKTLRKWIASHEVPTDGKRP